MYLAMRDSYLFRFSNISFISAYQLDMDSSICVTYIREWKNENTVLLSIEISLLLTMYLKINILEAIYNKIKSYDPITLSFCMSDMYRLLAQWWIQFVISKLSIIHDENMNKRQEPECWNNTLLQWIYWRAHQHISPTVFIKAPWKEQLMYTLPHPPV